jgi:D-methionine transport system ATP-binding protein
VSQISFSEVTKIFKGEKRLTHVAVDNVSFDIEEKEIFGVIGHSGAGKSTLVRLINQLEKPTNGEITVLGKSVGYTHDTNLKILRRSIGMIFQQFNLFSNAFIFIHQNSTQYILICAAVSL